MTRNLIVLSLAVAALALALPLTGVATAGPPAPDVPDGITVEEGNKPFLVGHAAGVQIYRCDGAAWTLVAPRANLYGHSGQLIATHFGGPSWQARDGSKVVAQRIKDPVIVDRTAIPWLLLEAKQVSHGPDGGRLAGTTFIQRINTTGGLAPAASTCTPDTAGAETEVTYTADYVFWKEAK